MVIYDAEGLETSIPSVDRTRTGPNRRGNWRAGADDDEYYVYAIALLGRFNLFCCASVRRSGVGRPFNNAADSLHTSRRNAQQGAPGNLIMPE
jgi:hypothetical protein